MTLDSTLNASQFVWLVWMETLQADLGRLLFNSARKNACSEDINAVCKSKRLSYLTYTTHMCYYVRRRPANLVSSSKDTSELFNATDVMDVKVRL